ncbi:MAG: ammonium transporter [Verrucomicrobiales bacterium]
MTSTTLRRRVLTALGLFATLSAAHAQTPGAAINSGDTAWLITASALVLFMMIPGLSLFYAGLVRTRNVLSIFMHCFMLTSVLSLVWLVCGYSLAFSDGNAWLGGTAKIFLQGVGPDSVRSGLVAGQVVSQTVPELVFFAFQMMFFLITPGLFVGAFAERMKFSAMLIFSILWSLIVYVPVCYGVWHNGASKEAGQFFGLTGVIDLAGGIVVHITAGVAALVACLMVGPRKGYPETQMLPHSLPLTIAGAGMLWVGWFGFNGGSQGAANGLAGMTVVVTHLSASAAAVTWMALEWLKLGRPSVLGVATGSIAGLAAITPASGVVGPAGAVCIGAISAVLAWFACAKIKKTFGYDDSLDVFGVHGIGGFTGTVLLAVFGTKSFLGGLGEFDIGRQLLTQLLAAVYTIILSGGATFIILKLIDITIGLRVSDSAENEGLDRAEHGESGYNV